MCVGFDILSNNLEKITLQQMQWFFYEKCKSNENIF
jgi:hypothetical protein